MAVEPAQAGAKALPRNARGFAVTTVILAVAATVAALVSFSYPSGNFESGVLSLALAVLAGIGWVVLGVLALIARRLTAALLVPPLFLTGVLIAGWLDLPLHARFDAARLSFEDAIVDRGEAGPDAPCPDRIGSYRITHCKTINSVTRFYVRDGGFLGGVGFAYAPDGTPAETGESPVSYQRFDEPWHLFVDDL